MRVTSLSVLLVLVIASEVMAQTQLTVTAVNKLKTARASETIELTAEALGPLGEKDLMKIHVRDSVGKEVLAQAVELLPLNNTPPLKRAVVLFVRDFCAMP